MAERKVSVKISTVYDDSAGAQARIKKMLEAAQIDVKNASQEIKKQFADAFKADGQEAFQAAIKKAAQSYAAFSAQTVTAQEQASARAKRTVAALAAEIEQIQGSALKGAAGMDAIGMRAMRAAEWTNKLAQASVKVSPGFDAAAASVGKLTRAAKDLTTEWDRSSQAAAKAAMAYNPPSYFGTGNNLTAVQKAEAVARREEWVRANRSAAGDPMAYSPAFSMGNSTAAQKAEAAARAMDALGMKAQRAGEWTNKLAQASVKVSPGFDAAAASAGRTATAVQGLHTNITAAGKAVGVYFTVDTLKNVTRSLVDMQVQFDRVNRTFRATSNSSAEANQAFEYAAKLSRELGLNLLETEKDYSKFRASLQGTAAEGEKADRLFRQVATASTAMGLSADDTSGVFRALIQIFGKGTIQMEEFKGQIGDRLPKAFQILEQATGKSRGELMDLMRDGKLAAEVMFDFGDALEKNITNLDLSGPAAEWNRMTSAWQEAQKALGDLLGVAAVPSWLGAMAAGVRDAANGWQELIDKILEHQRVSREQTNAQREKFGQPLINDPVLQNRDTALREMEYARQTLNRLYSQGPNYGKGGTEEQTAEWGQQVDETKAELDKWNERLRVLNRALGYSGPAIDEKLQEIAQRAKTLTDSAKPSINASSPKDKLVQRAYQIAAQHGVDPSLVYAVIEQESNWKVSADNGIAQGLMQIKKSNARAWGIDAFDPEQNMQAGVKYLAEMLRKYGDTATALAAYNYGPGNLARRFGITGTGGSSTSTVGSSGSLFARLQAHAVGNADVAGLNAEYGAMLASMIDSAPEAIAKQIKIFSAYRTKEKQAQLWQGALAKYGSSDIARRWVAPPEGVLGSQGSRHNWGIATDLKFGSGAAKEWVHRNAEQFGLKFRMSNEDWHIEPNGDPSRFRNGGASSGGSADALARVFDQLPSETQAYVDKIMSSFKKQAAERSPELAEAILSPKDLMKQADERAALLKSQTQLELAEAKTASVRKIEIAQQELQEIRALSDRGDASVGTKIELARQEEGLQRRIVQAKRDVLDVELAINAKAVESARAQQQPQSEINDLLAERQGVLAELASLETDRKQVSLDASGAIRKALEDEALAADKAVKARESAVAKFQALVKAAKGPDERQNLIDAYQDQISALEEAYRDMGRAEESQTQSLNDAKLELNRKLYADLEELNRRSARKQSEEMSEAWKQATRNIQNAMADMFKDMMGGDGGFQQFLDSLRNTIKTYAANQLAGVVMDQIGGMVSGSGGVGGTNGLGTGSSGGMGKTLADMASGIYSNWGKITSFYNTATTQGVGTAFGNLFGTSGAASSATGVGKGAVFAANDVGSGVSSSAGGGISGGTYAAAAALVLNQFKGVFGLPGGRVVGPERETAQKVLDYGDYLSIVNPLFALVKPVTGMMMNFFQSIYPDRRPADLVTSILGGPALSYLLGHVPKGGANVAVTDDNKVRTLSSWNKNAEDYEEIATTLARTIGGNVKALEKALKMDLGGFGVSTVLRGSKQQIQLGVGNEVVYDTGMQKYKKMNVDAEMDRGLAQVAKRYAERQADEFYRAVIRREGTITDIQRGYNRADKFRNAVYGDDSKVATNAAVELDQLNKAWQRVTATAKRYGFSLADVAKAQENATVTLKSKYIDGLRELAGVGKTFEGQIAALQTTLRAAKANWQQLGLSMDEFNKLSGLAWTNLKDGLLSGLRDAVNSASEYAGQLGAAGPSQAEIDSALTSLKTAGTADEAAGWITKIQNLVQRRYDYESKALTGITGQASGLLDLLKSMQYGSLASGDPLTMIAAAKGDYGKALLGAQANPKDATATQAAVTAAEAYLSIAKQYHASTAYEEIKKGVFDGMSLLNVSVTGGKTADETEKAMTDLSNWAKSSMQMVADLGKSLLEKFGAGLDALIGKATTPTPITAPNGTQAAINASAKISAGQGLAGYVGTLATPEIKNVQVPRGLVAPTQSSGGGTDEPSVKLLGELQAQTAEIRNGLFLNQAGYKEMVAKLTEVKAAADAQTEALKVVARKPLRAA